jgi:uncharacterized membrane protein
MSYQPPPQDPNNPGQYGGYGGAAPQQNPPPTDPYSGQQPGYQQPGYQQPGYQQPGYQQPGYQQPPYGQQQGAYQQSSAAGASGATSMGMQPNVAAGLSYVLGWITGLVFFLVEKQNRFVRFHAMQSILFFGGLTVLNIVLNLISGFDIIFISAIAGLLGYLIGLVGFVGWIVLLINGFQGKYFKLPIVGDYAERYANSGTV